jgi:AcrR family transcriptional regulator
MLPHSLAKPFCHIWGEVDRKAIDIQPALNIIAFTMTTDRLAHVRPPRRRRKGLQTPNPEVRRRLLDAGAELINDGGYSALRIEEIAARADLSVGTFYLYFDGKADLFVNLVQDYTSRLRERLVNAGGHSSEERLSLALDAYIDFVLENERGFLYFVRASGSMQTNQGPLSTWALNSHAADLQPGLEEAMQGGSVRHMDPALASQAITGLIQHLVVYWLEHKDGCSRAALKDFLLSFIRSGVANTADGSFG